MRIARGIAGVVVVALALVGCVACSPAPSTATQPSATASPTIAPTPTPDLHIPSHAVTFITSDHIRLAGTIYGQGKTYVIFSNQTDTLATNWAPIAVQFAARGYGALCYDYRGRGNSQGTFDASGFVTDLQAAIGFAQRQGAQHVILVGASIGGAVTALAAAASPSAPIAMVAMISAPQQYTILSVSDAQMASIAAPKLLMDSVGDTYAPDVQAMYDAARQPKELHIYPGRDHGIDLLDGMYGAEAMQLLLTYAQQYAPPGA